MTSRAALSGMDFLLGSQRRIVVCGGTGCISNGSLQVYEAFSQTLTKKKLPVVLELHNDQDNTGKTALTRSGCQGFCQMGPRVVLLPEKILYTKVQPDDVEEIIETSILRGNIVERLLYVESSTGSPCTCIDDIPFFARQKRLVLGKCGLVDPESIDEYRHHGGYVAAEKAFTRMTPEEIISEVNQAGLRGRGGGGFPTGRKWETARRQTADSKYVICNADEGDPGAFMNRSLMEGDPHSVIEGLIIAARAIGAQQAFVYVRAEYPLAVQRIRHAVDEAVRCGILGDNVFGSGLSLSCEILEGAGAFVCGEETAMIASIEGLRGTPRPKPPYPAISGLWGQPTVINNVETLAQVVRIINEGALQFRRIGTPGSPGTKTFALSGHVATTGLVEVPFGTTLREIVFAIGGGVTGNDGRVDPAGFKAVQIGGPSGGCLTRKHLDLPIDFDSLQEAGVMVGSGGLVTVNQSTCMVAVARFFMNFTQRESCGKCVPCREGTHQMLLLMDDIIEGRSDASTLPLLGQLARTVQKGSLCGLGKTAPNPVLSTLQYFRDEYEAHVVAKNCPTAQCRGLLVPWIDPEKCKGCGKCAKNCPVDAISGELKHPHMIDPDTCIRCGACLESCKFDAVQRSQGGRP